MELDHSLWMRDVAGLVNGSMKIRHVSRHQLVVYTVHADNHARGILKRANGYVIVECKNN